MWCCVLNLNPTTILPNTSCTKSGDAVDFNVISKDAGSRLQELSADPFASLVRLQSFK